LESACPTADLLWADEAFLTSTGMEVMPVTSVILPDGEIKKIGDSRVGKCTKQMQMLYHELVLREILQAL